MTHKFTYSLEDPRKHSSIVRATFRIRDCRVAGIWLTILPLSREWRESHLQVSHDPYAPLGGPQRRVRRLSEWTARFERFPLHREADL